MLRASLLTEVGELDGPEHLVFGEIRDVVADRGGTIYVLDSRSQQVRVFRRDGAFVETVGRPGRGPGELTNPLSLAVDERGRLYVGDLTLQVHVFTPGARGFVYTSSLRLGVAPYDMCFVGDRLFVHGVKFGVGRLIHEVGPQGGAAASFGVVYDSPNRMVNYQISFGRIACDQRDRLIIYVPSGFVPEARAYSLDGRLVWLTTVRAFRSNQLLARPDGRTVAAFPEAGWHYFHEMTVTPAGHVVLQIAFMTSGARAARQAFGALHSFLLDARTGRGTYVGRDLAPIVAVGDAYFVTAGQDPYPRFSVWSY